MTGAGGLGLHYRHKSCWTTLRSEDLTSPLVVRPPQSPPQEVYKPRPLEELEDQEAMASAVMTAPKKPVYIMSREDFHLYHPYYVNFKNPGRSLTHEQMFK